MLTSYQGHNLYTENAAFLSSPKIYLISAVHRIKRFSNDVVI